jgi:Cu(I)/Ag(I) efflux system membrane protein CusA/SilA
MSRDARKGHFLDFKVKRAEAARYGLTVDDVLEVVQSAIGGENFTTTVEGRELRKRAV